MVKNNFMGGLVSIVLGVTALFSGNVFAGPKEVYDKMLAENPVSEIRYNVDNSGWHKTTNSVSGPMTAVSRYAEKIISSTNGYTLNIGAESTVFRNADGKVEETKELSFVINDKNTQIEIVDTGIDGLSAGDLFNFSTTFSNSNSISSRVEYEEDDDYYVSGSIFYGGNKALNKRPLAIADGLRKSEISPLPLRLYVNLKARPVINTGKDFYSELTRGDITSATGILDKVYGDFKRAAKDMDKYLVDNEDRIRSGEVSDEALKSLGKMGNDYYKIVKGKLK